MRRVNDLAIEVGQAVHRPDEGLLDRAGGLVGARVQIGTAILRGSGAALDELACGFRDFKLVLKPAKRLRKRLVGRGAGLNRGLRRPFLLLRHLTSPSSLRANGEDRKSTRLNSSHLGISYAVFCLKKKKKKH